jgi:hypothetical protein
MWSQQASPTIYAEFCTTSVTTVLGVCGQFHHCHKSQADEITQYIQSMLQDL